MAARRVLALAAARLLGALADGGDDEQLVALADWRAARGAASEKVRAHHGRLLVEARRVLDSH